MADRDQQPNIRRLRPADAEPFVALRREALERHPLAFGAALDDDQAQSLEFVRTALAAIEEQAVFGHFEHGELRGIVGVMREARLKRRHRGFVWGMYVAPSSRRAGIGRALLGAAIDHARRWRTVEQLHLSVTSSAPEARRLYEAAGFTLWGREPRALAWHGQVADELHLVLDLSAPSALG